ncbi:MAG: imidazolonepropionase [Chlorobi bacterium]|nr:imidazolonepropionase [Chlorobiota bacterium]
MRRLIKNIRQLVQVRDRVPPPLRGDDMDRLPVIENAYLIIEDGVIADYGPMEALPSSDADRIIDASGRLVLPAWIDSHTHAVFARPRYGEFIDKIKGLSYEEIARRGGGIVRSAEALAAMSEQELFERAMRYVEAARAYGTGLMEIKSGYGLSTDAELKMLRVIRRLGRESGIPVKATFLGAHAVPPGMTRKEYVRLIIDEMLPAVAREHLADYADVFCEEGYFTPRDMDLILGEAARYGLKPKVHVNQFHALGGVEVAVRHGAVSVDHLEVMTPGDFEILADSETIATVLPGCSFFLGIPYAPAKEMIARGIAVAVATDFNPGSAPSWSMPMAVALAVIKQKLTPEQAINAATVNAAHALEAADRAGMIRRGAPARLWISQPMEHYGEIPYYFGTNPVGHILEF